MRTQHHKLVSHRSALIFILIVLLLAGFYWFRIHKPTSPEFIELQRQEKALNLPKTRRDTSDFGCQWVSWEKETQCMRDITLVYENTGLKTQIEQSLISNNWLPQKDATIQPGNSNFDKASPVHFESWDLYIKNSSQGKLCAVVKLEYNANYKKSGPWAVTLDLFGKTEDCQSHIS